MIGIGRSSLYEQGRDGRIELVRVGAKTYVLPAELERYLRTEVRPADITPRRRVTQAAPDRPDPFRRRLPTPSWRSVVVGGADANQPPGTRRAVDWQGGTRIPTAPS